MNGWFVINDLDDFVDKARAIVYTNFGKWDQASEVDALIDDVAENEKEEFDKILSHDECVAITKSIVKKQKNKKSKEIRFVLNEDLFADLIKSFNDRMVSNILQSLVKKGLVESSYDSEINDFVFWINDENKEIDKDKPETD